MEHGDLIAFGSKRTFSPFRTRRYSVTVRGNAHTWAFTIEALPEHVEEWRADGLEVDEVIYSIPLWVIETGLTRAWIFVENIIHFRNPFR